MWWLTIWGRIFLSICKHEAGPQVSSSTRRTPFLLLAFYWQVYLVTLSFS